jgi:diguanylate cyclase (GGDEF)-like protein/putative nucleotidyltransferase with HDIG domain
MSPHSRLDLLAATFTARTGAWIQSIQSAGELIEPLGESSARCRHAITRAQFDEVVAAEIRRARSSDADVTLAVLDIDHLANVNQDYGFDVGDSLIQEVERQLLDELRPVDALFYMGCGSWVMLLPIIPGPDVLEHFESVRNYVQRRLAIHFATHDIGGLSVATLSGGLIVSENAALEIPDMLQAASQATLASKLHGGNRTSSWSDATEDMVGRSDGRRRAQRDAQLSTVLSLAEALDLRDSDTSNHSTMVAHYSELMARELGLDEDHIKRVRVAGLLHDIGKIGVPDSILRKPAKLDDEEWAQMRAHPNIGAHLLASMDAEDIRSWVLAHHERPDGTGYPLGLSNDEIPIEAKILSVADAYEAMTVDRVYRPAPGPEVARAELERLRGMQFDDEVVSVFLSILERGAHNGARATVAEIFGDVADAA